MTLGVNKMKKTIVAISLSLMMATGYSVELSEVDQAKFNAAIKAYRMNQNPKALRLFTELYNDYPQNQQIKNNYAVVLFGSGKLEQAEEVLSSVIESNKDVNIAYKNLNKIYDYAAAKAYSNALGTEKEVTPQKLQIIETLISPAESLSLASNHNNKGNTSIDAPSALEGAIDQKSHSPIKALASNATNNVQVWADTWSKADVNSYVATALKDVEEPISKNGVVPAILSTPATGNEKAAAAIAEPAAKPKEAVESKEKSQVANEIAVIEDAIRNWVQAWSKGDVDSYITFYEPTFKIGKMSHKQWIKNRKQRISPTENIQVKYSELVITPSKTDDTIVANFKQSYQANQYKDETLKQLVWKKVGDKWFITKEVNLN
jgi:tetratricopeptide (TPR) repeat protein